MNLSTPCPTCGEQHDLDQPMPASGMTAADLAQDLEDSYAFVTAGGGRHLTAKGRARLEASLAGRRAG